MLRKKRNTHIVAAASVVVLALARPGYRAVQRVRLQRPLIDAVKENDIVRVRALLDAGADPNARDVPSLSFTWNQILQAITHPRDTPGSTATTALQLAAVDQHDEIATILVQYGANVNATSSYWPEYTATVEVIYPPGSVTRQPETGYTALMDACGVHDAALVKLLLDNSADPNAQTRDAGPPLVLAISGTALPGGLDLSSEATAETGKSETKTEAIVRMLLAHGASVGGKAAVVAAMNNDWPCVLPLLLHGADVNARSEDPVGRTLTIEAAAENDASVIAFLAEHKADLNASDTRHRTALMELCHRYSGELSIAALKTLLEHGANPNMQDKQGITALMEAAGAGMKDSFTYGLNLEAIQLLLLHGADARLRDNSGESVLQRMSPPAQNDAYGQKAWRALQDAAR